MFEIKNASFPVIGHTLDFLLKASLFSTVCVLNFKFWLKYIVARMVTWKTDSLAKK